MLSKHDNDIFPSLSKMRMQLPYLLFVLKQVTDNKILVVPEKKIISKETSSCEFY